MRHKTLIIGTLVLMCLLCTLVVAWVQSDTYGKQVTDWKEEARSAFEEALWMDVDKRSEIPIYAYFGSKEGMLTLKHLIPDSVSVMTKEGFRRYKIDRHKYDKSLIKDVDLRIHLSTLLGKYPISIDTLTMNWDSCLYNKLLLVNTQIRYIHTDLNLRNDTIYSNIDNCKRLDSLTVKYLGFRCEHEFTGFVAFPAWWSCLSLGEWLCLLFPWAMLIGILFSYAPLQHFLQRKFVKETIVEKEIHLADVPIDQAEIYQLPDGCLFNSLTATLTKGEISQRIRPQSALLLKLFLQKENNCLSAYEIEHGLWNGQGTTDQLHKAIQRLRTDLKNASSEVLIKNVNGNYELKLLVASNDLND